MRWQGTLDWLIARKTSGRPQKSLLQILLRVGLYQLFWLDRFPKLGGAMYIDVGWAGIVIRPAIGHRPGTLALIAAGGILYTLGAILFALHKPILSERWFGYHEVWHAFGVDPWTEYHANDRPITLTPKDGRIVRELCV